MVIDQNRIDQLRSKQFLNLDEALYLIKNGFKVFRKNWKGIQYIQMQRPDENSKMKRAYLFAVPQDNQAYPYQLSNMDVFADDWQFLEA